MVEVDLVITGGTVITQNPDREIIDDGTVIIKGDSIEVVARSRDIAGDYEARRTVDASGKYVFPGLVNTHTHLFQTFMKGLGEGLTLYDWLRAVTAPSAAAMDERDAYLSAMVGLIEALHSGTTTTLEYLYGQPTTKLYPPVGRAFKDTGIRGLLGWGFIESGEQHGIATSMFRPTDDVLEDVDRLRVDLCSDLVGCALAPGISFGMTRRGLETIRQYATDNQILITLHTNETHDDNRACLADYGKENVPFLEEIGFWGPDVLAVHCVQMTPEDIEIFARYDVKVSHNPISNMYLGSGAAQILAMRDAGLTVSLAVDGAASNNSQDMLEVMKCTGLMHKLVMGDPAVINAADVMDMATIGGARALGMEDSIGSLEPGKKADLFIFDPLRPKSVPVLDPISSLVFSGGEDSVIMTVVNGEVVLEDNKITTVDEEAIFVEAQKAAWDLAKRAGTVHLLRKRV